MRIPHMQRDVVMGTQPAAPAAHLAVFARQFATMVSSGMSLLRALSVLEEQAGRPPLRRAIGEVRIDIERGLSLSSALGRHERVFPLLLTGPVEELRRTLMAAVDDRSGSRGTV